MDKISLRLGQKIKELRSQSGLSQQDLADELGVPRPSISRMEAGERKISAEELIKLAHLFNVSVENLLNLEKSSEVVLERGKRKEGEGMKTQMRISVPQKNVSKFKEVLLYILNKVGSKPNIGETVIYKLLYFIDFDFYEKYEEQLIGATYIKNHHGPTPVEFIKIVEEMIQSGQVEKVKSEFFKYPQTKYLPHKKADLTKLKAHEIESIDEVLNKLSDMTATQISDYSHGDIPWITAEDQAVINYESVFYRAPQYSVRDYDL
ncbi:MAG: DUF4065 domain-containing protein [Chlamydiae bacterium]|nr:DUF4065 domain-containing protein [Chlamydiota bacterium]MBI3266573.1 DUF4065 domain-containing protein [Chlamydiota bacterium]